MPDFLTSRDAAETIPITLLAEEALDAWLAGQDDAVRRWVAATGFKAKAGSHCLLPEAGGGLARVLAGYDPDSGPWGLAALPGSLPQVSYRLDPPPAAAEAEALALGWWLACYEFDAYKKGRESWPSLVWPEGCDQAAVTGAAEATALVRDLVNTPAGDLGPAELAGAARRLAEAYGAEISVIEGDRLLDEGYPAVHAVGRASSRPPHLADLRWGESGPRVTLVGKGVCFDSGGLDLKTAKGMELMKKDMGGAAHVLGVARMVMDAGLPLRLRVLVPAVENAVSGDAFRPLDVLRTRKGLTVEVGNTDAEGRLILCDALAEADTETPDLVVDFATLTGAARVALGTELPALFCNNDAVAETLLSQGLARHDPLWRMPLHKPYRRLLDSKVADLNNISDGPYGGAITAALFMAEFLEPETPWVHIDVMAWNLAAKPGRPAGGEAMGMRAVYGLVEAVASGELVPRG
ncbi:MAG: leucyl aminopeptidase family protein [Kiloniellales bacterium]|nr:leucyl aminopeptidase family protein [Kiloniellales bacterium]